eukprot:g3099.t1
MDFLKSWFGQTEEPTESEPWSPCGPCGEAEAAEALVIAALRVCLRHWVATGGPLLSPRAWRAVSWTVTPSHPRWPKGLPFIASFPGFQAALDRACAREARLNEQLHAAVQRIDLEAAEQAVSFGADVNSKNKQSWTSLHIAASKGSAQMCRLLLDAGADPAARCTVEVWPEEVFTALRISLRYVKARLKEAEMEVHVEAANAEQLPKGCYVSVRVGDVLKQGRYEPQRAYNFPGIDRRRDVRIDVYQHVGNCLLTADSWDAMHDTYATSTNPDFPAMKFKVSVSTKSEEVQKSKTDRAAKMKGKAKDRAVLWT